MRTVHVRVARHRRRLAHLAWQGADERLAEWLGRVPAPLVTNAGLPLPDRRVALVASALRVFAGDLQRTSARRMPGPARPPAGAAHPRTPEARE